MSKTTHRRRTANFVNTVLLFSIAFLLGIAVTLAAIGGGIYAALAYVTLDKLDEMGIHVADRFLEEDSELRQLSVIGMVGEIYEISGDLSNASFNSLVEKYGVIVGDNVREYLPDGLEDLPFSAFAGENAAHVLLSHVKFSDVFAISGEVLPATLSEKLADRTLDLAVEKKLDRLLEGVYLGDAINVALEVRDDGLAYPIVDEGESPSVVQYLATLDMGAFFGAEDSTGKDAVLNATLSRIPLTDMLVEDDSLFGDAIAGKTLGDLLVIEGLSPLFSVDPLLGDLHLGQILGYHRVYAEDGETVLCWADDNGVPAKGLYRELVDIGVNDLDDVDILGRIDNVYVAELMNYERVEDGVDENGDPIYRFYRYDAEGNPIEPSGITADIAVLKVGDLRDEDTLNAEIRNMQIGTVMGYTEDASGIWRDENHVAAQGVLRPLLGSTVASLSDDMNALYLGQVMGFDNVSDDPENPVFMRDGNHDGAYDDPEHDITPGSLMAEFVSLKLSDIDDESKFTDRVKNVRVGDAMGYTLRDDGKWYQKNSAGEFVAVSGLFASLANSKVTELDGAVQELSIADALGYEKSGDKWVKDGKEATGIFRVLMEKEANLNNLSDKSKEIQLGELMGYTRTADGFEKNGAPVVGIIAEFVDLSVADLESDTALTDKINNMALGTAMGYTYDKENDVWRDKNGVAASGFMQLIGPGTTILGLDDAIAGLQTSEKGSIQAFMDAGILELDDTTITILDARLSGWREMSINMFVNELIGLIKSPFS